MEFIVYENIHIYITASNVIIRAYIPHRLQSLQIGVHIPIARPVLWFYDRILRTRLFPLPDGVSPASPSRENYTELERRSASIIEPDTLYAAARLEWRPTAECLSHGISLYYNARATALYFFFPMLLDVIADVWCVLRATHSFSCSFSFEDSVE